MVSANALEKLRAGARIRARRNGRPVGGALDRELGQALQRLEAACEALRCASAAVTIALDQVLAVERWESGGAP